MPAPRPRFRVIGKFASAYMPKEYTVWKDRVIECVRGVGSIPSEPLEGPLLVTLRVLATKPRTSKLLYPSPDVDNYAKGVLDALSQSLCWWADDKQVVRLDVAKGWADAEAAPGIEVSITPL